jgi:phosphonate transport system substrate-binding protein
MFRHTAALAATTLILLLSACGQQTTARARSGPAGWPPVLRYNVATGLDNPEVHTKRIELLRNYLSGRLGISVEITEATGYGGTIEAMRSRKIDAASLGPFAYLLASEKAGAEAIVTLGLKRDGSPGDYAGTLSVAASSPIRSMDEAVKHAKDLTISFVDPASASGYLVERAYLDSLGLDPEHDFKKVVFSNNHIFSAMTLVAGKADIAAISENTLATLKRTGRVKDGAIRTLWTSPRIPNSPIAVRKELPADLKKMLQDAFIEMPATAPEAYAAMFSATTRLASPDITYVRVTDAAFDGLRAMARNVKHVQLLDGPEK